ncbi:MAG: glycosyltransferase family A protein [Candidatus Accumulibacter sp.]|uniref:glycosyltransferase family 2 protein n=1 Tax=Accumulibacter sp. TaxID=2053492 RepID=UPI0028795904|nr:glycosyltransferase family A protein [Accumulibacter sp.]MDS4016640.1 glycosyltransferase family A protein [Accumulibacter sp.]
MSIGVPVRNGGNFLAVAMRSVIDQSERDIEIIVSDNGSDDGTGECVLKLAEHDPRIRYFRQDPPISAYDNFHFVLSQARGRYFMWAAHDDSRDLDFVARLADRLDQDGDAVLAFGDLYIVTPDDKVGRMQPFPFSTAGLGRWRRMKKVSRLQCFNIYGLWRTSAIRRVPYAYCSWWLDLPMMMSAAWLGHFAYVAGPRFYYFEIPKTNLDRAKYQDFASRFNLPGAVLQLVGATYRSCSQVGGPAAGLLAAGLVFWKQVVGLPGFLARRIRAAFVR